MNENERPRTNMLAEMDKPEKCETCGGVNYSHGGCWVYIYPHGLFCSDECAALKPAHGEEVAAR